MKMTAERKKALTEKLEALKVQFAKYQEIWKEDLTDRPNYLNEVSDKMDSILEQIKQIERTIG